MLVVFTGDIVDSSKLKPIELDQTLEAINDAAKKIKQWPNVTVSEFSRRAGDSWQIAFNAPIYKIRAMIYIQACVRALQKKRTTRIAAAIGEGVVAGGNLNYAHGEVFTASGRLLDELSDVSNFGHAAGGSDEAMVIFIDLIANGWTQAQASAVAEQINPNLINRDEIAKRLKITRQSVNGALWSAGFKSIELALSIIEEQKSEI